MTKSTPPSDLDPGLFDGLRVWAIVGTVGWEAAVPIIVLGVGGALLDKRWNTGPFLTLLGCVLALVISSLLVWRTVQRVQRQIDAAEQARQRQKQSNAKPRR